MVAGEQLERVLGSILGKNGFSDAARNTVVAGLVRKAPSSDAPEPVVQSLVAASEAFDRREAAVVQQETTLRNRLAMAAVGRVTLGEYDRWEHNERQYALILSPQAGERDISVARDPLQQDEAPVYRASTPDEAVALSLLHRYSGTLAAAAFADKEKADVVGRMVAFRRDGDFEHIRDGEPPQDEAVMPNGSENRNELDEESSARPRTEDHA